MKLSRDYLIVALALVVLYLLFMSSRASSACLFNSCTTWLNLGSKNPNPKFYKAGPIKSLDNKKIAYCKC